MTRTYTTIAAAALMAVSASMLAPAAMAANQEAKPAAAPMTAKPDGYSDRRMGKDAENQRELLERSLQGLTTVEAVRAKLATVGYTITAVNESESNHVEYEVVKGNVSYEVKLDMDAKSRKVTEADVAHNVWRAASTKAAMEGKKVKAYSGKDFSDRERMPKWTSEKDQLEKSLAAGDTPANYMAKLKSMGYTVTNVNDREKDYVEYEVVKGDNSYEVQIDIDSATGKAKVVDVAANLWRADKTEQALERRATN